jgi:hypothetical protein
MADVKSFAWVSSEWATWEKSEKSALYFCDWLRENGHLDPHFIDSLQSWLTSGGLSFFEAELQRLTTASAAFFAKRRSDRG